MPIDITDVRSSPNDQIAHAARVIGRSEDCQNVFNAISYGKKKIKTVTEITDITSLPRIRVLQLAGKLCNNQIVKKVKVGKELAYEKDQFFSENKNRILKLARNKNQLEKFPTKINPINKEVIYISIPKKMVDVEQITIDDIDSFDRVKDESLNQKSLAIERSIDIEEKIFKKGLQKILKEEGIFQDWGGETDDLFSTRLVLKGRRKTVVFGLKGKGTTGILTPEKMGKRADQIQRLFRAPADVFLVQYGGQINETILEQIKNFAISKSYYEGKKIYYGLIDGQDSVRIINSYNEYF